MSQPQKRQKRDISPLSKNNHPNFDKMYQKMIETSLHSDEHPFAKILSKFKQDKHPILQVIQPQNEVYKTNPEKKKKPIQLYLDTVNHLYKKKDLDILINPVTPSFVFEKWSPKEVAIFEEAILRFGKQFQFISELIISKNPKEVY